MRRKLSLPKGRLSALYSAQNNILTRRTPLSGSLGEAGSEKIAEIYLKSKINKLINSITKNWFKINFVLNKVIFNGEEKGFMLKNKIWGCCKWTIQSFQEKLSV